MTEKLPSERIREIFEAMKGNLSVIDWSFEKTDADWFELRRELLFRALLSYLEESGRR